jgi:isoleucyl-tRNA synthetase
MTGELVERAASGVRRVRRRTRGTSGRSRSSSRGFACPSCGGTAFERERDILDVWFDSGSSHEAVLPFRPT